MDYNNFKKYLNEKLDGFDINKKKSILLKIRNKIENSYQTIIYWLNNYEKDCFNDYTLCKNCNKYFNTTSFKNTKTIETKFELIYSDCGYGDDDEYGDVLYFMTYEECPACKNKKLVKKEYVRTLKQ